MPCLARACLTLRLRGSRLLANSRLSCIYACQVCCFRFSLRAIGCVGQQQSLRAGVRLPRAQSVHLRTTYETLARRRRNQPAVRPCCRVRSLSRRRIGPLAPTFRQGDAVACGILRTGPRRASQHFLPNERNQQAYRLLRLQFEIATLVDGCANVFKLVERQLTLLGARLRSSKCLFVAIRPKRLFPQRVSIDFENLESGSQVLVLQSRSSPIHSASVHDFGFRGIHRNNLH